MKKPVKILVVLLLSLLAGCWIFYFSWSHASPEKSCLSCHELQTAYDDWTISSHRDIRCEKCHGTALSSGWHSLSEKAGMVFSHITRKHHEDMYLNEGQVLDVMLRCRNCHENEYAGWVESGHSATYMDIFLNERHNSIEQPYEDCLRCHGMFFDGSIADVVQPLDTQGRWSLVDEELNDRPVIPCLTCHHIHSQGIVAQRPDHSDPTKISYQREPRLIKASFYDRREIYHFAAEDLPILRVVEKSGQEIMSADDARQRLCVQCHAPNAFHQAGTGDDRTPRGVHEGFGCLACHETHTHDTRQSCGQCHPILSNCGLDVKTMNTTFYNPDSPHNIHFVTCQDCHTEGVPR
ncbi:hypothetical protein JXA70_04980 [candidate division KSB1 bacterium]|nr:hypothetical protein [candidate division KSB1 bacterium]